MNHIVCSEMKTQFDNVTLLKMEGMALKKQYNRPQILNREKLQVNQAVAAACYYTGVLSTVYAPYETGGVYSPLVDSDYYHCADRIIETTDSHITSYSGAFPTIVAIFYVELPNGAHQYYEDYFPHFEPNAAAADATEASSPGFAGWTNMAGKTDNWQDVETMDPAIYTDISQVPGYYEYLVVTS